MKTEALKIPITIPKGYEFDAFDKKASEVNLKAVPTDVTERIQSLDDAIAELGEDDEQVIILRKLQEVFSDESHPVNNQKAIVLTKAFNEGWIPDWNNTNQAKYFPWFEMGGSCGFRYGGYGRWTSGSVVGSRLCFKSSRLAENVGRKFTIVYKNFMTI
jgi:hypothetical protein